MGKMKYIYCCLGLLLLSCISGCKNTYIIASDSVNVYENHYDPAFYKSIKNDVKMILKKGDRIKLITMKYDKNYAFYKVKLYDGSIGYIFSGSSISFLESNE